MANSSLARMVTQLKDNEWLGQLIDQHAFEGRDERWVAPNLEIHPSGVGSICARDIELGLLGHRTKMTIKSRRRMDNGTDAHKRWNKELANLGVLINDSVKLKIPGEWSGEYDLMVMNPVTGTKHLGEIKTMNAARFKNIPAQLPDYTKMTEFLMHKERGYVFQVVHYLVMFKKRDPDISEDMFFLFENTDNQDYVIRWFRVTEEVKRQAFVNSTLAQDSARSGVLLDPPFKRGSAVCRKCYREKICYELQDEDELAVDNLNNSFNMLSSGQVTYTKKTIQPKLDEDIDLNNPVEVIKWG